MPAEIKRWLADLNFRTDRSRRPCIRVRVKHGCEALVRSRMHEPLAILPDPGFPDSLFDFSNVGSHRFQFHENINLIVVLCEFQSRDSEIGDRTFVLSQVKITRVRVNKLQGGGSLRLASQFPELGSPAPQLSEVLTENGRSGKK